MLSCTAKTRAGATGQQPTDKTTRMIIASELIFVGAALVLISIAASLVASRIGAPLLLVFLLLGLAAGREGIGGIAFADIDAAALIGSLALAIILFDGGLKTKRTCFRVALAPAATLATLGVILTAGLTGLAAWAVFGLPLAESLLIGAIVSPTDAAAVFFLLHLRGLQLKQRVGATLEVESGSNDPMAVFLTLALVEALAAPGAMGVGDLALAFALQMGLGAIFGLGAGWLLGQVINRVRLAPGLYPLLAAAGALFTFALVSLIGGSGFLAVYLAGLVMGNRRLQGYQNIMRFHDGLTWLSQITMFLMLGLLVLPSELFAVALPAIALALLLMLVFRPLAVWLCLLPFGFSKVETSFISWVGLRGAVPMVLALFPMAAGVGQGELFFNIAFFVVLTSLLIQGWTLSPLARWLKLNVPADAGPLERVELSIPALPDHELIGYRVDAGSPVSLKAHLPPWARPMLVVRDMALLPPDEAGTPLAGDTLYLLAPPWRARELDPFFVHHRADERSFYGEFVLNGDAPVTALTTLYGVAVPNEAEGLTVADFFAAQFNGRPVVGDDIVLGEVALVVDAMEQDRVRRVGLDLNPRRRQAPPIPFLPDRRELAVWWRRTRPRLQRSGAQAIAMIRDLAADAPRRAATFVARLRRPARSQRRAEPDESSPPD